MSGRVTIISAALLLAIAFVATGRSAPGDLDPAFGVGGKLLDGIARGYDDSISAAALQADGKIVAVGTSNGDIALARYNPDGSLDISFGSGGKVTTAIGPGHDAATSVVVQADGRILVAGMSWIGTGGGQPFYELAVVRYRSDGTLDSLFGSGGIVTTRIGVSAQASSVSIQTDGKIVAVGTTHNSNYNYDDFALVRYNPNGSLDPTFGGDGIVTTSIAPDGPSASRDAALSAVIQADGKIVAAGFTRIVCTPSGCDNDFALVRYNSDGSLDGGFGNGGIALTGSGPGAGIAFSIAIQPDGKLVAAGTTESSNGRRRLIRYHPNGSLDSTFGSGGKVVTELGGAGCGASSVSLGPDGKILTAGRAHNGQVWTFALSRHNSDGSLDTSFDGDGILMTPFESYGSYPADVLSQPDGKILAAGEGNDISIQTHSNFAMIRYNPDGSPDLTFDSDGKVTTNFADVFIGNTLYDAATQNDGKVVAVGVVYGFNYGIARYDADGSLDPTFGNGTGKVAVGSPAGRLFDVSVAVQPDGKIVVAGLEWLQECFYDLGLAVFRFNSDGSPDTTFGDSGVVRVGDVQCSIYYDGTWIQIQPDGKLIAGAGELIYRLNPNGSRDTTFGGGDGIADLPGLAWAYEGALRPDGKILTAGPYRKGFIGFTNDLAVARLNPDGTLDATFGSGGVVTTPMGIEDIGIVGRAVAIQTDGKIVAGGHRLVRFNDDGSLDTGFGNSGVVTPPIGPLRKVVVQSDGRLVIAGTFKSDFAVVRYDPNGSIDSTFGGGDGITTVDFNGSNDTAYGMTLDAQGRAVIVGESSGAFAIARVLLRSGISLTGRVTTPSGQGLRNATVVLTDSQGVVRTATTSSFGIYIFEDVEAAPNYTLTVRSKRYRFTPRTLNVNSTLTGIDLVGLE